MTAIYANLPGFGRRISARRRPPTDYELTVDSFAGWGGWGLGEEAATGWAVDVAINHDPMAIEAHRLNHPATCCYESNVFEVDPRTVEPGRPIGHCHFSPDCTHHSKARGGAPVSDRVRGLAWVVLAWAYLRRPRVITLENVEEFRQWGPTTERDGEQYPDKARAGQTFAAFIGALTTGIPADLPGRDQSLAELRQVLGDWLPLEAAERGLGYRAQWRELRACDYGAPTIRKRFFLVARCDGEPIIWPEPTHGPTTTDRGIGTEDVGLPELPATNRGIGSGRHDPEGISNHGDTDCRTSGPARRGAARHMRPYRTAAECIDWSLACPSIFMSRDDARAYYEATGIRVVRPLKPATLRRIAAGVVKFVLENPRPFLVHCNHAGTEARVRGVDRPMDTLSASRDARGLVVPHLVSVQNASSAGVHDAGRSMPTITAWPKGGGHALCASYLVPRYGENAGQSPRTRSVLSPMPTVVPTGNGAALCAAFLAKHYGGVVGSHPERPIGTISTIDHHSLVAAFLQTYYGTGANGRRPDRPAPTITTKDRVGLVTVVIDDITYIIADIGMRMLQPHELIRAQFGELADGWVMLGSKADQVAGIGNSVCPHVARAIVLANYQPRKTAPTPAVGTVGRARRVARVLQEVA